jgi:putative transposase
MESTIGLYKTELIKRRGPWRALTDVELGTAEWIDWYNNRRLHGEIGHVPPVETKQSSTSPAKNRSRNPNPRVMCPGFGGVGLLDTC